MIEMTKEVKEYVCFKRKRTILNYAENIGSNIEAIRTFKISRSTFYKWKKAFDKDGPQGLLKKRPIANTHPNTAKLHLAPSPRGAGFIFRYYFTGGLTAASAVTTLSAINVNLSSFLGFWASLDQKRDSPELKWVEFFLTRKG